MGVWVPPGAEPGGAPTPTQLQLARQARKFPYPSPIKGEVKVSPHAQIVSSEKVVFS